MEVQTHEYDHFNLKVIDPFHLVKESTENIVRPFLLALVDILILIRTWIACAPSLVTPVQLYLNTLSKL